jgi:hypothetical protein
LHCLHKGYGAVSDDHVSVTLLYKAGLDPGILDRGVLGQIFMHSQFKHPLPFQAIIQNKCASFTVPTSLTDHIMGFIASTHVKDKQRTSEVTTLMYNLAVNAAKFRARDRTKMVHLACGLLSNHRTAGYWVTVNLHMERGSSHPLKPPPPGSSPAKSVSTS